MDPNMSKFKYFIENILNFYVNIFLINFGLSSISILIYILQLKQIFSLFLIIILSLQIFTIIQIIIAIINIYRNKLVKFPFKKKWFRYSKNIKEIIL